MRTTPVLPAVVTTIDDDGGQRISVFGADRAEICGAFKPVDRPYRPMYVTKTIADARRPITAHPDPAPPSAARTTRRPTVARTHRRPVCEGGEPMNPSNVNRKLAEEIEPHRYQTNASLRKPATTGADRPVREYVTNVSWRANQ
jgi:hypothetical protein